VNGHDSASPGGPLAGGAAGAVALLGLWYAAAVHLVSAMLLSAPGSYCGLVKAGVKERWGTTGGRGRCDRFSTFFGLRPAAVRAPRGDRSR
jgi:hypothetical protein